MDERDLSGMTESSVVESMFDRPVRQAAQFLGQVAQTWFRGGLDPWGLGVRVATAESHPTPPFAFLALNLFIAGVSLRLWLAMESVMSLSRDRLVTDLRMAIGDVSLTRVMLVTFPCILIVVVGGKLLSLLVGNRQSFKEDRIVAAACFAAGYQAGMTAAMVLAVGCLKICGFDPSGTHRSEVDLGLMVSACVVLLWGVLILTPAIRSRMSWERWWSFPVSISGSSLVGSVAFVCCIWVLGVSIGLYELKELRAQRHARALLGDLYVTPLEYHPVELGDGEQGSAVRLALAYTNYSKQLVVVSRNEIFSPDEEAITKESLQSYRVTSSSLDELPDRALLIEPGATRVAEYTLLAEGESQQGEIEHSTRNTPYRITFHRRESDGGFLKGQVNVMLSGSALARMADRQEKNRF